MPDRRGPMKVWTNRVPIDLVERWKGRAAAEGSDSSAMLRDGMETLLASDRRITRDPEQDERAERRAMCEHPRKARRHLGYSTVCGDCGVAV